MLALPEIMIWVLCAWAFLPLTLMMRGIALFRVYQIHTFWLIFCPIFLAS
jgi:hypothetical protein